MPEQPRVPGVRLWLDDLRPTPAGWARAHSVNEAIARLSAGPVAWASLDFSLGRYTSDGGSGDGLTDWMAEHGVWPTEGIRVHTSSPWGERTMLATIDGAGPYPAGSGVLRGRWPTDVLAELS